MVRLPIYRLPIDRMVLSLVAGCLLSAMCSAATFAQADSSPEAKAMYADAASFQNAGAFDVAIDEWQKFLKKHPTDPLAPKAQHYAGVCYLQLKKYNEAIAAFEALRAAHPKFELMEDAMLNLGWCRYTLANAGDAAQYPPAAAAFEALLAAYPTGKYSDQALYFLGESKYATGKKDEAIAAYDRMVKGFEKSPLRCEAVYALGVAQEETAKYPAAGLTYDLFLKDCAKSELVTEVRMRKAETLLQAGDFANAAKMFGETAATAGFALADHALYRQAFCAAKLNQFLEAGALYGKVAETFPQSTRVNVSDATLAAGRSFYRGEKFDDAAKWFAKSLAINDANAIEAAHWLCRIHLKSKQAPQAAELAAKMIPAAGKSEYLVSLIMDQADALYEIPERRAESLPLYVKLATEHPQHALAPQALYNAAYTSLELKKFAEGQKFAADFLKAYPQDKLLPDMKYVSAECYLQDNKAAEAQLVYNDLVSKHADHAEIDAWRLRLALALYLQKRYDDVVKYVGPLVAAFKTPEQKAEGQYLVGVSHFYANQFPEAEAALTGSITAAPKWRQADETLLVLSRVQRKLNKTVEAIGTASKIITEYPESKLHDQARYRLGEYRYAIEDYKNSTVEYDVILTKFPESTFVPYALYGKGWAFLKMKDFPSATKSLADMLEKYPQHALAADAYFARSMSRRQQGDFAGAVEDVAAFLKTNPTGDVKADALYERGLAEAGLKQNDAAVATFQAILKESPKYVGIDKVLYELAWALKSQDKNAEALPFFAQLANEHPESPLASEAYFHVGEDQYDKKQFAEAIKTYTFAKQKSSGGELGEKSIYKLGWSNFQLKQYPAAFKEFEEQLTKYPQGALVNDALFMKAESLFRDSKYKEALPAYQAASAVKASSPAMEVLMLLHGGQAAGQLKQWDVSLQYLTQIPTKFPDTPYLAEALYETAFAKQNSNKPDEALKDYAAAAEKSRTDVGCRARFMMGELYFEQKNYSEAIREFQRGMYGYGGETASPETKGWQAMCGYEAGRCAEVQLASITDATQKTKMIADAKKFYGFVAEKHPDHRLAPEAKKRLEVLGKL